MLLNIHKKISKVVELPLPEMVILVAPPMLPVLGFTEFTPVKQHYTFSSKNTVNPIQKHRDISPVTY